MANCSIGSTANVTLSGSLEANAFLTSRTDTSSIVGDMRKGQTSKAGFMDRIDLADVLLTFL